MRNSWVSSLVAIMSVVGVSCCPCGAQIGSAVICLQAPYSAPPDGLGLDDLAGTWEARYGERGVDVLVLKADGTFRQVYHDFLVKDYAFDSGWNNWTLERCGDDCVRLHLARGRYYLGGIDTAERRALEEPPPWGQPGSDSVGLRDLYPLYDPIARDFLYTVGELVLSVRADSTGEMLLHHMWTTPGRGFAVLACEAEQFRRIEAP